MFLAFDQVLIFEFLSGVGAYDGVGKVWRDILVWVLWPEFVFFGHGWFAQFSGWVEIGDVGGLFDNDRIGDNVCSAAQGVSGQEWRISFVNWVRLVLVVLCYARKRRKRIIFCRCTLGSGAWCYFGCTLGAGAWYDFFRTLGTAPTVCLEDYT